MKKIKEQIFRSGEKTKMNKEGLDKGKEKEGRGAGMVKV